MPEQRLVCFILVLFTLHIALQSDRSMEHTLCVEYLLYVTCLLEACGARCWCLLGMRVLFC